MKIANHRIRGRTVLCVLATMTVALPAVLVSPAARAASPNSWETVAPMGSDPLNPTPRQKFGATSGLSPDNRVYAAGGSTNGVDVIATAEAYDPATNAWAALPSLKVARRAHALVTGGDGRIYTVGGHILTSTGTEVAVSGADTVEAYNPAQPGAGWQPVAPLAQPRSGLAAVSGPCRGAEARPGCIYALGGTATVTGPTTTVEMYDPSLPAPAWVPVASMKLARSNFGAAVGSDGRIYAVGGGPSGQRQKVEAYNPKTDTWDDTVAAMPHPREFGARAAADSAGRIYVLGGFWGMPGAPINRAQVEVYDPADPAGGWTSVAPMSATREEGAATSGPDGRVFALGGYGYGTNLASVEAYTPSTTGSVRGVVADFTGDTNTDISVFRPSSSAWFVSGGQSMVYGTDGDIAVPGDYYGDDKTDIAVFRPSTGNWFVHEGVTPHFGTSGDIPVPGNYHGDAKTDIAVFRPSTGNWFVQGGVTANFGISGDIPVPADYDNDGDVDIAVFRPSSGVWFVQNGTTTAWGTSGDIPVPADYDGDGDVDIAVFRPSSGVWFVQNGTTTAWGASGDIPVPGHYDSDSKIDVAVFRPSSGTWFVRNSLTGTESAVAWGTSGDVPLPLPYAVRQSFS